MRKEDFAKPFYRRLNPDQQGIACVLTSMEQGARSSPTPTYTPPSGDAKYRFIEACRTQFLHYYWYIVDPVAGQMSVRVATYFPFKVTV